MLVPNEPAIILAPMEGMTDAPMRAFQSESGAFTYAVAEFFRIAGSVPSVRAIQRHVPELRQGAKTPGGLRVQVQLLGGHPGRLAESALVAVQAGAEAIDLNFGCPAKTVNRHDGGASLLKHPQRIREIVVAVRAAVPPAIPVSAKLRLGWECMDDIYENAAMAAEGGASWLTIHGRTRAQGYAPPAYWNPIGRVREQLGIPVIANGDLWTIADLRRCREETGCLHYMLGRGAMANPRLPALAAQELGLMPIETGHNGDAPFDWPCALRRLAVWTTLYEDEASQKLIRKLKQWLKVASLYGDFTGFDTIKRAETPDELFAALEQAAKINSGDTACQEALIDTLSVYV